MTKYSPQGEFSGGIRDVELLDWGKRTSFSGGIRDVEMYDDPAAAQAQVPMNDQYGASAPEGDEKTRRLAFARLVDDMGAFRIANMLRNPDVGDTVQAQIDEISRATGGDQQEMMRRIYEMEKDETNRQQALEAATAQEVSGAK